jgi:stalled ribosome rescue protein Dom34
MKRQVGVWIDHREAVIVMLTDEGEQTTRITSQMEKHVRFASGSSEDGSAESTRDRQFASHLDAYYDKVIASIRAAESILIFGPGEAKGELEKRLENKELGGRIVGIETADKMTDGQIAARVRQHFSA